MYIKHFGMIQYPFSLTPNTRYFLKLPTHEEAFQQLLSALDSEETFIKLVGEVGTGKTMLCRKVLNAIAHHKEKYVTAYIPHPYLDEQNMMLMLAGELSLNDTEGASYRELLKTISKKIVALSKESKKLILFIDEAQAIPAETLSALHLLSSIDTREVNFQVILFGQPELDLLLDQPMLHSLKQSMSSSLHLQPLDRQSVGAYIEHRLIKAGYNGNSLFTKAAVSDIFEFSNGIPRLVNVLCHKSLMVAYGKGQHSVTETHTKSAILDSEQLF
ncbi:MAG: ExeA family protein [Pseudohongiellaceae bacterium]